MIKDSARKHGVRDEDIEHVLREWLVIQDLSDPQGRPFILYVGPDTAGRILEVGINYNGDAIHAMPARPRFLPRSMKRTKKR